jgi:lysophospholipase L1-like esterase
MSPGGRTEDKRTGWNMTVPNPPGTASQNPPGAVARTRRRRHRIFALTTFALLLVGQEGCFRVVFPLPEVTGFNRVRYQILARGDPRSRSLLERGLVYDRLRFGSEPDGFSEVHQLNLYGFRGSDFAIAPPRDRRRILVIGDSVVEGVGAPDSASFPSAFAQRLARDGERAEVINLGVASAQLHHSVPLARDAIALLRPTDVIFVFSSNDVPVTPYPKEFDLPAPRFRRSEPLWWMPRGIELVSRLANHEPIYRRWPHVAVPVFFPVPDPTNPWTRVKERPPNLDPVLHRAMTQGKLNPWIIEQPEVVPHMLAHDFAKAGGSPERYLSRVAASCRSVNARLVVGYVPFSGVTSRRYAPSLVKLGMDRAVAEALSTDPRYRRQNAMLTEVCRELQLPLADTTESMIRAEAESTQLYWDFDGHPRPAGYAVIAQHVYDVWRKSARGGRDGPGRPAGSPAAAPTDRDVPR